MRVQQGYLKIGEWGGAPIRVHWTLPLGALVFGRGEIVPGFWLGFFLIVLIHEIGHAYLVVRHGYRVLSIDVHGLGGVCRWAGDATAIHRAEIAWGGVTAQAIAFLGAILALTALGQPRPGFVEELAAAFTAGNVWLIALNLVPIAPLDGAEAWKLPRLLRERRRRRVARARPDVRAEVERELAALDAREKDLRTPRDIATADALLRRIAADARADKPS